MIMLIMLNNNVKKIYMAAFNKPVNFCAKPQTAHYVPQINLSLWWTVSLTPWFQKEAKWGNRFHTSRENVTLSAEAGQPAGMWLLSKMNYLNIEQESEHE